MTVLPKRNHFVRFFHVVLSAAILWGGFLGQTSQTCYAQTDPAQAAASDTATAQKPKYIFLFIGDGMGLSHRMATEYCLGYEAGETVPSPDEMHLTMDRLPVQSPMTTFSADCYITDSAASGTAIACGAKTNNKYLGIQPDGRPMVSIAKVAHEKGYRVGILTSVSLDHATPAAFYATVTSRYEYGNIPSQLIDSSFEYFAGGGLLGNLNRKADVSDFYEQMKEKGFSVVQSLDALRACEPGGRVYAYSPTLAGGEALPWTIDKVQGVISLAEFTEQGIRLLDNPNGFFMMVEGGRIDWAGHGNDAGAIVTETIAMDDAVTVAYDFLQKHPNETLILVTADHETGGLTVGASDIKPGILSKQPYSVDTFRDKLHEVEEKPFEDVLPIVTEFYGGEDNLAKNDRKQLEEMWNATLALKNAPDDEEKLKIKEENRLRYGRSTPNFVGECVRLRDQASGIFFSHGGHTSTPVITSAAGVGQELFTGFHDNTDIAKKLAQLIGAQLPIVLEKPEDK